MKRRLIRILLISVIIISGTLVQKHSFADESSSDNSDSLLDNADFQFGIGQQIEEKDLSEQRYKGALQWYYKAAEQDHAIAQFRIGAFYAHGLGVTEDKSKAYEWFLKSAQQGYAPAQNIIGEFYTNGWAFETNYKEADQWFFKSANQNFVTAQYNLGMLYYKGLTGIKNDVLAYKWILLASLQKDKGAIDMKTYLDRELTNKQKEHGIELSRYFIENYESSRNKDSM